MWDYLFDPNPHTICISFPSSPFLSSESQVRLIPTQTFLHFFKFSIQFIVPLYELCLSSKSSFFCKNLNFPFVFLTSMSISYMLPNQWSSNEKTSTNIQWSTRCEVPRKGFHLLPQKASNHFYQSLQVLVEFIYLFILFLEEPRRGSLYCSCRTLATKGSRSPLLGKVLNK